MYNLFVLVVLIVRVVNSYNSSDNLVMNRFTNSIYLNINKTENLKY